MIGLQRSALLGLVVLAAAGGGCLGQAGEQTATPTTATAAPTQATPEYGTQFVSLSELNETEAKQWNESDRVAFENLSEPRKEVFLTALEDGQVERGPDESHLFDFHDESRPKVVRYEGSYYYVRVAIV